MFLHLESHLQQSRAHGVPEVLIQAADKDHRGLATLIECKDQKQPLAVEKVDAFATKARDAHANKAVIICSAEFQSGCNAVAQRRSIDLFRLNERINEPPGAEKLAPQPVLGVYDTILTPGKYYTSMLEQNYYCEKVENGSVTFVLVEAYMHGNLIQAKMGAKVDVQKYYVEITDFKEILRLQKMYQKLCATGGKGRTQTL